MVENIDHNVNRNICIFNTFCVNVNLLSIQPLMDTASQNVRISLAKNAKRKGLFSNKLERFSINDKSYAYFMKQPSLVWDRLQ